MLNLINFDEVAMDFVCQILLIFVKDVSSVGSASNDVEGNLLSLDGDGSSASGNELSNLAMDGVTQEQPLLPYSQKALETLKLDKYPYYVEREWWKDGNRMTFWSTWRMKRDVKRRHLLAKLGPDRVRLKALKCNTILPEMIRDESAKKLHNFPKGSCPNLVQHLCQFSGARRGKLNRFHLHRQIFRRLADHGQLSGIQRGVW